MANFELNTKVMTFILNMMNVYHDRVLQMVMNIHK